MYNRWNLEFEVYVRRGWGTPLFVLYGYVPLDRVWCFGLAVLNRLYNLTSPVLKRFNTYPKQGMVCEKSLSFLRLRPGPCEKLKEFAIERTSDAFLFLICIRSTE